MEEKKLKADEFEAALNEILNQNIKYDTVDVSELSVYDRRFEEINQELLKYYQKRTGNDFEEMYKSELELAIKEKLEDEIDKGTKSKSKDEIDEQEEKLREMSNEALDDEDGVGEEEKKEAIKEASKDDDVSKMTPQQLRALIIKEVYKEAYEKYTHDILEFKKVQSGKENITTFGLNEKAAIRSIMTERYLGNLNSSYKLRASEELEKDPEISKLKEKFNEEIKDYDRYINKKVEENLGMINELNERRNEVAKKMASLDPEATDFKEQSDALQQEYMKLTFSMNAIKPSLNDYQRDLNVASEYERVAKINGVNPSDKEPVLGEMSTKNDLYDNQAIKDVNKVEHSVMHVNMETIESGLSRIDELMRNYDDNIEQISEILETLEMQLGIQNESKQYAEGNTEKDDYTNEKIANRMEKGKTPISSEKTTFMDDYKDKVQSDEEAEEHGMRRENTEERIEAVRRGLDSLRKDHKDLDREDNVKVRTLYNNKK